MTKAEQNKRAMDDIFALEDARSLFEAIGGINDPMADNQNGTDFGVDDMLTVIPGSSDNFNGQSINPVQQAEPSAEDKKFVIDRFAEEMAKAHKTIVDQDAIDSLSPIIQNGVSMDVNKFLTDLQNDATQRLRSQNVSEAQPAGADPQEPVSLADAQQPAGDMAPAPDAMGTPALEPAPGAVETEPTLDANVGDDMAGDNLGLDAIPDNPEDSLDSFGAEPALGDGDDLGLDGIDDNGADSFGDGLALDGADGADGVTDDAGIGADAGAEDGAPIEDDSLSDNDSNLAGLSDDELGGSDDSDGAAAADDAPAADVGDEADADDSGNAKSTGEADDNEEDAEFEAEMLRKQAILESLHDKYVDDAARASAKAIVESYVHKYHQEKKKAMMESQTTAFIKDAAEKKSADENAKFESTADAMRKALAESVGAEIATVKETRAHAVLESAANSFKKVSHEEKVNTELKGKLDNIITEAVKKMKTEKSESSLKAKLESISKEYHANVARTRSAEVEAEKAAKPVLESVAPKAEPTLENKLQDILARAK